MNFESELKDQLHAGVDDADVDIDRLIAGGRATGRRFTRRRRIGQAMLSVTATAAVVGVVVAVGGALAGPAQPSIGPAGPATQAPDEPITPQAAWKIVIDQLPKGGKFKDVKGGHEGPLANPDIVWAKGVYTDAKGPSQLSLNLDWRDDVELGCNSADTCKTQPLADGRTLVLLSDSGDAGEKGNEARIKQQDGWILTVRSDNATTWKGAGTRPEPPLSQDQLRAIVLSLRWQQQVPAELVAAAAPLFVPTSMPVIPPHTPSSPTMTETPR
ncbi:hypothetical protein HPO96_22850 [Kribbella sandramycini]|uniref:Uncharacterized protein n=1 Tax=Kribbella sandramycini TaxID=60450 RepID=A0A7Y4L2E6_9ACTN|nr:hypothetical protein [Kribbella sandramycini]MBB6566245.1 hypothetical protein [Kribbella sandramycini]NOL43090.1 hypothetical protein [Kribbella sandramycini]